MLRGGPLRPPPIGDRVKADVLYKCCFLPAVSGDIEGTDTNLQHSMVQVLSFYKQNNQVDIYRNISQYLILSAYSKGIKIL